MYKYIYYILYIIYYMYILKGQYKEIESRYIKKRNNGVRYVEIWHLIC